jgi:hypothetical protein
MNTASSAGVLAATVRDTLTPKVTALETQIGDVETTLDNILAIQENLIGGGNV